jgi:hypothetical protein
MSKSLIFSLIVAVLLLSCKDEVEIPSIFELEIYPISDLTGFSADIVGEVINPDGISVEALGISWGTSSNPMITDNNIVIDENASEIAVSISGLNPNTLYYVRPYHEINSSIVYGTEVNFKTSNGLGEMHEGGVVAYILKTDDSGYDADIVHGFIVSLTDIGTNTLWGCDNTKLSGAGGANIGDGFQNTNDILAGCPEDGSAARLCANFVAGSYDDWYLPSKEELRWLNRNRTLINETAVANNGTSFSSALSSWYWSSTQIGLGSAWAVQLDGGFTIDFDKVNVMNVRAIRSF